MMRDFFYALFLFPDETSRGASSPNIDNFLTNVLLANGGEGVSEIICGISIKKFFK